MPRHRRTRPTSEPTLNKPTLHPASPPDLPSETAPPALSRRARIGFALGVTALLVLHYALAARSLLLESPTVDEVVHLPAGVTYWQQGTFRLYHHNPPLIKLVAALPVVLSKPLVDPLYQSLIWRATDPSPPTFSQVFARMNAERYFELFNLARLMMPLFSIIGGLAVFAWSRRLYGPWGGLLSLALWVFCPNVLAHARLVTTDLGSTALGVAATYLFWRYLHAPSWKWAGLAGVALGVAQLSKFSMLLLLAVWPVMWLIRLVLAVPAEKRGGVTLKALPQAALILAVCVLVIDAGYLFEGVGRPLGEFEFGSRTLTRPAKPGESRPRSKNPLLDITWQFRVNRFRGGILGGLPSVLPAHYLLGFDEQKIETEGVPIRYTRAVQTNTVAAALAEPEPADEPMEGYAVYLDGELRRNGWWSYYLLALAYKVPEGTIALVGLALLALLLSNRSPAAWADESALLLVPTVIVVSMTLFTDINLGLRYILPIFPYLFISAGKLAPWIAEASKLGRSIRGTVVGACLGGTIAASVWIAPHYLAYFNWASGGPDRVPAHLIDSNLDWGQDLLLLRDWWEKTIPDQPLGVAYFGQINPSIFWLRGQPFNWFLPPGRPGSIRPMTTTPSPGLVGPPKKLEPGYYAISATLLYGLPWRLYDPADTNKVPEAWAPAWNAALPDAYGYFRTYFTPIGPPLGHSIYIYHLTEADIARAAPVLESRKVGK